MTAGFYVALLLLDDLQDFHGASLNTDATCDALGGRAIFGSYHNLHGANFNALAAGGAELLVDHVNTGLGVLSDSTGLTDLSTLATLDANLGLSITVLAFNHLDAAEGHVIGLIKCLGTGLDTLQAGHASLIFLNSELLHRVDSPLVLYFI